ncbi:MAG: HesB/IscA family protein, partial [Terriglobia bacterium]
MATLLNITPTAVGKVKEIMSAQQPQPLGLRLSVVGGGCSGFSYQMNFETESNPIDKTFEFEGLKVFVDQASLMYLNGTQVDFVETLSGS